MQRSDAIIIGAGIIGLSLALELDKRGLKVRVIDKGEPGREASWAAGGMLADFPLEMPAALHELAHASAHMYPEFVRELEEASGKKIDLRDHGTLVFLDERELAGGVTSSTGSAIATESLSRLPEPLESLEPALALSDEARRWTPLFLPERSVDPRQLTSAALAAARSRGVEISASDPVIAVTLADGKAAGVRGAKGLFEANIVVNCAGAWAGQIRVEHAHGTNPPADSGVSIGPRAPTSTPLSSNSHLSAGSHLPASITLPTRPVKGQMLCVAMPHKDLLRHVVRTPDVYLIPRSDGRLLIGATQEEAGFDTQTVAETMARLRHAAVRMVPQLADATFLEAWAGLRPGTPDALPILGATSVPGYFVATGHFRDGILLAPVTARVMGQVTCGEKPEFDLAPFAAERFQIRLQ